MKLFYFLLVVLPLIGKAQLKYVSSKDPVSITIPEVTNSGEYKIKGSLNLVDSIEGFAIENFSYLPLDIVLVTNDALLQKQINPTISRDKLTVEYNLTSDALGTLSVLSKTDWKVIGYSVKYKVGNEIRSTSTTYYPNPSMNADDYFTIQEFKITQPRNESSFRIKPSKEGIKINSVSVKFSNDKSAVEIANCKDNIISEGGVFSGIFRNNSENGFMLTGSRDYYIEISYTRKDNSVNKKGYNANLKLVQDFIVTTVQGLEVYDNRNTNVTVRFTAIPKVAKLKFDDFEKEIQGVKTNNDNEWIFPIPSGLESFSFGTHNFKISGEDVIGTPLSGSNKIYVFTKTRPTVKFIDMSSAEEKTISILTEFTGELTDGAVPEINFKTAKGTYKSSMVRTANQFSFKFKWSDETMRNYFDPAESKAYLFVSLNGNQASSDFVLPVQIISKEELEKKYAEGRNPKQKRQKIASYLEEKQFTGDIENVSASIVTELAKEKKERSWDNVWTSVVKLAPKVIGALILLI